jgi:hypothetical protein
LAWETEFLFPQPTRQGHSILVNRLPKTRDPAHTAVHPPSWSTCRRNTKVEGMNMIFRDSQPPFQHIPGEWKVRRETHQSLQNSPFTTTG